MNTVKHILSSVSVVVHEHLDSLTVDVHSAGSVITLLDIGVLVGQTSSE